jgi:hypothetical protein
MTLLVGIIIGATIIYCIVAVVFVNEFLPWG